MNPTDDASSDHLRSTSRPDAKASDPEETLPVDARDSTPTTGGVDGGKPGRRDSREDPERTSAFIGDSPARDLDEVTTLTRARRFGNYELLSVLGRGGMGIVFKARQTGLDRLVAVKMIRSGELASGEEVARFYAEAQAAAKIEHPHVVNIYDVGEIDGHHFFSMDYLEGHDLAHIVRHGPLESKRAARLALQMAMAVQAAHDGGILHRDLKPANIVIDNRDHVTVTDFGLAKSISGPGHGLTQSGTALGTPSYMSPEQASGRADQLGPASDVYSLGAVLYAMCTGGPPFHAETLVQTIMAVIDEDPPPVRQHNRSIDPDLATICMKCLHKDPQRRYPSAAALAEELQRYLNDDAIEARPAGPVKRAWLWTRRVPLVAALMGRRVSEPSNAQRWTQRGIVLVVVVAAVALILAPILRQLTFHRMPSRVTIAAGRHGGRYHELGRELAEFLQTQPGCREARVVETQGSLENASLLLSGKVQLALLQEATIDSQRMAVVAPVYYEAVHLLMRRSADVRSLSDMNDRALSVGLPASGMNHAAELILDMLQVRPRRQQVHYDALWDDPSLEGAIITMAAPSNDVLQMLQSGKFMLLPLDNVDDIARHPAFMPYRITSRQYPDAGLPEAGVISVATPAFLVAVPNAPGPLVDAALTWLFGQPRADVLSRAEATRWSFMPLHSASREFFRRAEATP